MKQLGWYGTTVWLTVVLAGGSLVVGGLMHVGGTLGIALAGEGLLCLGFILFRLGVSLRPSEDLLWLLGRPSSILLSGIWLLFPALVFVLLATGLVSFLLGLIQTLGPMDARVKGVRTTLYNIVALSLFAVCQQFVLRALGLPFWFYLSCIAAIGGVATVAGKRWVLV